MFSQFQMRYSTLLFDSYYQHDFGQTLIFEEIQWSQTRSYKDFYLPIFSRIRFLLSISFFGNVKGMIYDVIRVVEPFLRLPASLAPFKDASERMDYFIKDTLLDGIFGISRENWVAFKMNDRILVVYMVDITLVLVKLAAVLGIFDIPELGGEFE